MTVASDPATLVELALAAAPGPLSIDTLVGWNLARPADLWKVLGAARGEGRIRESAPGSFTFEHAARRDEALARATPADWAALLDTPERISWAIDSARAAAEGQRFDLAAGIFRALVARKPRDTFPGGERGWLGIVLQSLRLIRTMTGLSNADLEEAMATAVELGDVGAQGVLHGALGAAALRDGRRERSREHLAHARDAALACSGPLRAEIHMYLAMGLVLQGRMREGIETFEALLGGFSQIALAVATHVALSHGGRPERLSRSPRALRAMAALLAAAFAARILAGVDLAHVAGWLAVAGVAFTGAVLAWAVVVVPVLIRGAGGGSVPR